jgi:hypothetical protein
MKQCLNKVPVVYIKNPKNPPVVEIIAFENSDAGYMRLSYMVIACFKYKDMKYFRLSCQKREFEILAMIYLTNVSTALITEE